MRKMPSMIIITSIKARLMTSKPLVIKTKEKSVNMRPAGICPAGLLVTPTCWFLMGFIGIYPLIWSRFWSQWS